MKLEQTGPGTVETGAAIRDSKGKGLLPLQVALTGPATYKIFGRVSPEGRWQPIRDGDAPFLESISWVPYLRLEVLSGTGKVTLWLGEE